MLPGVDAAVRELCASPQLRVESVCIHRCSKRHTRYLVSINTRRGGQHYTQETHH